MKWNNKLKYWIISIFLALVTLIVSYIVYTLYSNTGYFDSVNSIVSLATGFVSFLISVVALIFSVITYVSIDSVNALSSMEGNVLCNENYNAEYMLLVKQYGDCKTQLDLRNKLIQDVEQFFKSNNKSCMAFTDSLQYLIDRLLWFAYVDTKNQECNLEITKLINKLEKKYNEFNAISNGNQYVLREHIKLIKNVLNYQSITHEGKEIDAGGEMLNIRGRMLMNSVSKTIYFDYLGLEYHKKAIQRIKEITNFNGEEFVKGNMEIISNFNYTDSQRMEIVSYLKEAQNAFDNAIASSENDLLWKGYISFNKARIDLTYSLINNTLSQDRSWEESLCKSIETRYFVEKMFITNDNALSFLELEFVKERMYAEALYLSVLNFTAKTKTEKNKCVAKAKELSDNIDTINSEGEALFQIIKLYLNDVISN